jgi:hypothetical protein
MSDKKVLIYDLEIVNCIPPRDESERDANFAYCGGWRDFKNMGISCAAYGWLSGREPVVFDWQDERGRLEFVEALQEADIISGFNSFGFDDKLLAANDVDTVTTYDLLYECRLAAYGSFSYQSQPRGHSYALDSIGKANNLTKTGHGALAPQWWQLGKYEDVRAYCQNDVVIEREALQMALDGKLVNPNTGELFKVRPMQAYVYC